MRRKNGKLHALPPARATTEPPSSLPVDDSGMTEEEARKYIAEIDKSQGIGLAGMESSAYKKLILARKDARELDSQIVTVRREIENLRQREAQLERTVHMTNGKIASVVELLLDAETQRRNIPGAETEKVNQGVQDGEDN